MVRWRLGKTDGGKELVQAVLIFYSQGKMGTVGKSGILDWGQSSLTLKASSLYWNNKLFLHKLSQSLQVNELILPKMEI